MVFDALGLDMLNVPTRRCRSPEIFLVFSYWWQIMEIKPGFHPNPDLKLMDQVREVFHIRDFPFSRTDPRSKFCGNKKTQPR